LAYTVTTWVNGTAPAVNATNLNKIETGISDNDTAITEKTVGSIIYAYKNIGGAL
jgi:hypothetical protein